MKKREAYRLKKIHQEVAEINKQALIDKTRYIHIQGTETHFLCRYNSHEWRYIGDIYLFNVKDKDINEHLSFLSFTGLHKTKRTIDLNNYKDIQNYIQMEVAKCEN